ncbi:gamma-glutamylcyclotransferase [Chitinibacter sp. SCUT-21]|uniref:gamma-glutamylcyclotransferase family protein n=1 Tax=Chitinibacter sp. SCUT-21 TaxID=2970891 RepID=UPI0035A6BFCF
MTTDEELLFVYGTLKRGLSNHHWLGEAQYVAEAQTQNDFALYTIEYPFLSKEPALYPVHGELYRLSWDELTHVDVLEQHPDDYCRELIDVVLDNGQVLRAWAYFHPNPSGVLLADGYFDEHGLANGQPVQAQ